MQFSWKNSLKALPFLLLLAAHAGAAFGVAGNVQFVIGDVKLITKAGETRALVKGAEINEGDRVTTAANASAQIKMVDGGFIAIRPNTNMGFDTYRYSGKEDGTESAVVSLLRGGFRTITGLIGHTNKQNYLIKTETATIGIRGTDHEPMVIPAPAPGQVAIAEPGTYDKVNVGVAFIRTDAGSVDIRRNQVGFAPVSKAAPVILPKIPPFYKPTPAPGTKETKGETKGEGKSEDQQTAAAGTEKSGEEKKDAAPADTAAAAPAETAVEAPAQIRDTSVADPTSTVTATAAAGPV
ncbi:MAG: FecR domain-containing protein, partial [Burkholderiales bacterium]|nr:FecR domain-containing protein [Burkholderiales bacterium]